jgi:hypothetical protein
VTRGWARALAWGSVGVTVAAIPTVRLIIAQPHPGQLGAEGSEGTPLVYVGVLAFSIVGALIISRHTHHLVGWIFCVSGADGRRVGNDGGVRGAWLCGSGVPTCRVPRHHADLSIETWSGRIQSLASEASPIVDIEAARSRSYSTGSCALKTVTSSFFASSASITWLARTRL